jgi:hypothetical protein
MGAVNDWGEHRGTLPEMGTGWRPRWRRRELLYVPCVVAYRAVRVSGVLIASRGALRDGVIRGSRRGSP